ncbi:hypothetical protein I0E98_15275 [Pseudomonas lalucatii]|nr:hypothetical protein [Pseudomonas lalucatii]
MPRRTAEELHMVADVTYLEQSLQHSQQRIGQMQASFSASAGPSRPTPCRPPSSAGNG